MNERGVKNTIARRLLCYVCIFIAVFCGCSKRDREPVKIPQEYISVFGTNARFVETVTDKDDAYWGYGCYEDEEYRYYVDISRDFTAGIEAKQFDLSSAKLSVNEIAEVADDIFSQCMSGYIVGDISYNVYEYDGVEYPVEFIETLNGFETGTRALVLVGESGKLYSASFVKGSQYEFYPDRMLNEADALDRALVYICEEYEDDSLLLSEGMTAAIRTVNDRTVWNLVLPMEDSNSGEICNYYVLLDVYSGELVMLDREY